MKKILILLLLGLFLIIPARSAEIKITIADDKINDIIEAFASDYNYRATINGQPNPETKKKFANRMLKNFIKSVYISYKSKAVEDSIVPQLNAVEATKQNLLNEVNNSFTGIQVSTVE
jgi:hypothetical protein